MKILHLILVFPLVAILPSCSDDTDRGSTSQQQSIGRQSEKRSNKFSGIPPSPYIREKVLLFEEKKIGATVHVKIMSLSHERYPSLVDLGWWATVQVKEVLKGTILGQKKIRIWFKQLGYGPGEKIEPLWAKEDEEYVVFLYGEAKPSATSEVYYLDRWLPYSPQLADRLRSYTETTTKSPNGDK